MILSISSILVIVDTLQKSLRLQDGGKLFLFTQETRNAVMQDIIKQCARVGVNVEVSHESNAPKDGNSPKSAGESISH